MVQTQVVKVIAAALDELLILAESATGDNLDGWVYLAHLGTKVAHALLITVDTHFPHLVVYLPVFHIVRFRMSVGSTLRTPFVSGRGIAVAQPVKRILKNAVILVGRTFKLDTHYDDRLGIDLTAEAYEFIGAEAVLVIVHPHPVCPPLTVLLRADAPLPVVLCHIAAAWPA